MNKIPDFGDKPDYYPVILRTDYSNEETWRAVLQDIAQACGDDTEVSDLCVVDDPEWAAAESDDVLNAVRGSEELRGVSVVFIADYATMNPGHHALLAVLTNSRDDYDDDESYEWELRFGREFRTVPRGVASISANLVTANMEFVEFSEVAHHDTEGVYRDSD
ncbi:DUF6924 domain-containing protein [Streptomyces sp. NPDC088354]|uniref:DUF6924 domain-containing protein n=1 Tax=Streptomyces sp. NPDC088354 TaxID=3365856 RepID=UPI0037F6C687